MDRVRDRFRLTDADRLLLALTILVKVGVLATGAVAYAWLSGRLDLAGTFEVWNRWDAPHYLDLVVFGYRAVDAGDLVGPNGYRSVYPGDLPLYIVFYPLFPWAATAVNAVLDNPLASALTVSTLASLFVAPLMHRLVRHDHHPGVALRAAWFVLIFPTAYFLHIGYTESLFMALVLGAMLAGRGRRWWLAGLLGGLAALTRVNGLVLLLALGVEAATQWYEQPAGERRLRPEWAALGLVAAGFAAYLALNLVVYGDAFEFLRVQRTHWFKEAAPPWDAISGAFGWLSSDDPDTVLMHGLMELLFTAIGLAGVIASAFLLRPSLFAWMAGNWLLFTSTSFLLSIPRYTLTLFPLMILMAVLARRTWALVALSALSLAGFVYFAARFALGDWAF
jgi:hypothetical protein